jgi:mono/diheme cytochrome c family protein
MSRAVVARGAGAAAALTLALAAAVLVACGGGRRLAAPAAPPDLALGRSVFVTRCTVCHALGGIGPRRSAGGDLSGYAMSPAEVRLLASTMPVRPRLTRPELRAVAAYVAAVQARVRRAPPPIRRP